MPGILSEPRPECAVCGTTGIPLYKGLIDRLFAAPGSFSMSVCPECGLHWLDPMPLERELHKCYEGYFSPDGFSGVEYRAGALKRLVKRFFLTNYLCGRYGYRHLHNHHRFCRLSALFPYVPFLRKRLTYHWEMFFPEFKPGPGNLLVDVGCGRGEFLELMKGLGWEVLGIENDPEGARIARDKGVTVFEGRLEDAGLPASCCHQVSMHHVVEHLHDPARTLVACLRILRPGGRLVLRTPNAGSMAHAEFKAAYFSLDPPRHLFLFSPRSLGTLLEKAGFRNVRVGTRAKGAQSVYNCSRRLQEKGHMNPHEHVSYRGDRWFALRESAACRRGRLCGEEIEAVGEK